MWVEFFILGGIWFWLLTGLFVVLLLWEIHSEKAIAAGVTIAVYLAALHLFGNANFFSYVGENPAVLYIGLPAFFAIGTVWIFIKWFLYVNRHATRYKEMRLEWLKGEGLTDATINTKVPDKLKKKWSRQVANFANYRRGSQKPLPRENKGKIITWGVFWPLSMLWSIIDEPWRYIYDLISGWLHGISDFIYKRAGYDEDMEVLEKK